MSNGSRRLEDLIRFELASVPASQWRYFFPCQVAVWKYIAERRPDLLGEFCGGFDTEPYFEGRGADWFIEAWDENDRFWSLLDAILRPVVDATAPLLRANGDLRIDQVPQLPQAAVVELAELIDAEIDKLRP